MRGLGGDIQLHQVPATSSKPHECWSRGLHGWTLPDFFVLLWQCLGGRAWNGLQAQPRVYRALPLSSFPYPFGSVHFCMCCS